MDYHVVQLVWSTYPNRDAEGTGIQVSVTDTKGQLTELVRRAEVGDEVVPIRHGHAAVRVIPVKPAPNRKSRRALLEAARISGSSKATPGPNAALSQDFLYEDDGLRG
jgi:antitoxin (DNA-binding transcriptional repressor) of toxin-antitoxin stability system